ncbi:MAG: phosphatidylethanolamine-binding protein [Chlamydiales bacterium]|nr:phosphatidylethanolamine-binding protein [Chlamydiales bacterium]
MTPFSLASPAFQQGQLIPPKYTCQGQDISPPLDFIAIPPKAKSLALIVDDPDAPGGVWDHWVVWNLPPEKHLLEDCLPAAAKQGKNSWGNLGYGGPCPPSGTHRYFFKAYALDQSLTLHEKATKQELEQAMAGHILAQVELVGLYRKG